ncbi:hypothetical protein PIB30_082572, partial [Stylosanthes scabra]|nr:hypothetical protein [Stylosanthes scabra]
EKSYHIIMEQDRSWMYDRVYSNRGGLKWIGPVLGHRADAVAGGLRSEESLFRHVQLPDSDAEWRIRVRFDAKHASPTASTATTASCSNSCSVTDACPVTASPIAA